MNTVLMEGRHGNLSELRHSLATPWLAWCAVSKALDSNRLEDLEASYKVTSYQVLELGLTLKIGKYSADLEKWCREAGVVSWAFVTACNPYSEWLSADENQNRMDRLREELVLAGYHFFEAIGSSPDGTWTEPSYFMLGMTETEAIACGDRWGQVGVVVGTN